MYDTIIVGGGPAGLTAALYALRAKKKIVMIERMIPGGQVAKTLTVENYPGFESISGFDLANKMYEQVTKLGLEIIYSDILEYDITGFIKKIKTHSGTFEAKTILLCLGAFAVQLEVENEKKFIGKGISYCATCDGNFFKDKTVAVVGGGSSSIEDTLYLYDIAKKIYIINRRDKFICEEEPLNKIKTLSNSDNSKIEIILNSVITSLNGDDKLENITVKNKNDNTLKELKIDGLFVTIGRKPDTELLKNTLNLDDIGYILTDENMKTNIDGVFAAGDVRHKTLRQIVTACADGAIASMSINNYISTLK
ncbi:MAG: thioredoxin-disulfide reductase [Clostridia bacterium]|nr:thioredoxin-disulfide reductase [Clostridia bacterium]